MANLTRVTGKIFGETASTTNNPVEIGQFGSAKLGTYNATGDIAAIQNLTAWSNGWIDAVTPTQQFPSLPEMTGVHKVLSQQIAYILQKGVPEWDAGTTYYTGDFAKSVGGGDLYVSLTDNNINNALSNTTYWKKYMPDILPSQTGNSGKFLTTNGSAASWATIPDPIPSQVGNSGKILTTNGVTTYWTTARYIVETYINGNDWYRIYAPDSTGYRWCEQGGKVIITNTGVAVRTIELLKEYKDTNYTVICTKGNDDNEEPYTGSVSAAYYQGASTLTTSSFKTLASGAGGVKCVRWMASGYIE